MSFFVFYIYVWQFLLKMVRPPNPPHRENQISWYKFKLNQNFNWTCNARHLGIWFCRIGTFWGCCIFVEDCHTHTYPKSPIFYQKSPIFYQKSPIFYQKSPIFYQKSPIFYQKSPIFCQKSPIFYQNSPTFYQKIPIFYQKSPIFYQNYHTHTWTCFARDIELIHAWIFTHVMFFFFFFTPLSLHTWPWNGFIYFTFMFIYSSSCMQLNCIYNGMHEVYRYHMGFHIYHMGWVLGKWIPIWRRSCHWIAYTAIWMYIHVRDMYVCIYIHYIYLDTDTCADTHIYECIYVHVHICQ